MADDAGEQAPIVTRGRGRRIGCSVLLLLALLIAAGVGVVWFSREGIVGNVIGRELASRGIHATYHIEQIGVRTQILSHVVVGDPQHPDLTIERAVVRIRHRFGLPRVSRITLIRPRLYGTYLKGTLSFGELDPLLFEQRVPKKAFKFPNLNLAIEDGRALLETDFGAVAAKVNGSGNLQDGFQGELGAISPRLVLAGCELSRPTLYGRVAIQERKPRLVGPARLSRLACSGGSVSVRSVSAQVDVTTDEQLAKFDGTVGLQLGPSAFPQGLLASAKGDTRFTWREGGLTSRFAVEGRGLASAQAGMSRLAIDGTLRARRNFDRIELDADVSGDGVRLGSGLDAALTSAARATGDTFLAPLLAQIRGQLARESRGSSISGAVTLRRTGKNLVVVVPGAALRGGSGATLLSVSRFQLADTAAMAPQMSGSFASGGSGLPRIVGTMERRGRDGMQVRLVMAEYRAGASRLAIPELALVQRPNGTLGFSGTLLASGPLPGGRADNLLLPISGGRSPSGELVLWRECTDVRFDRLQYANLVLTRQTLTLCPARGAPILRYGSRGLRLAVGAPSLRLTGTLGQTPVALRSGPVGFAYPGALTAREVEMALGPAATAQRFLISDLTARIGKEVSGRFVGTDVRLFSVPLDVLGATGEWRYSRGRLTLDNASFRVEDRRPDDRFNPVVARGGQLVLENNLITAHALLREPRGDRTITDVNIRHDLATGRGRADLAVAGITFGRDFQPTDLTDLARGVVANVNGTIAGSGAIEWSERGVTSTGRFSSNSLDFAAAFGPVKGASGTVEFSDLLGLTTAPNQRIHVASINPGIEVNDGDVEIQLRNGQVLALQSGTFPFMGGTLTLRPLDISFGAREERRYIIEVAGLDAAKFVERMELNNIQATGIFDGTIPILFDVDGVGQIRDGTLVSRAPGGNISYIGALTYENLGAMANYAFDALKSLDYSQMRIVMNGNLTGEIVTNVRFDGVKQGAGAKQNFITRQIAKLPIRFDVNIRAPFYSLLSNIRSMYDPTMVKDPRELGLIDSEGNVIQRQSSGPPPAPVTPRDLVLNEPRIQRRESEDVR